MEFIVLNNVQAMWLFSAAIKFGASKVGDASFCEIG
jgi:hypothetical protein